MFHQHLYYLVIRTLRFSKSNKEFPKKKKKKMIRREEKNNFSWVSREFLHIFACATPSRDYSQMKFIES